MEKLKKHKLDHARHDPSHCLAPGLFRSLKRGDRKKLKLDVKYQINDKQHIEFKGPEPLGADDLRVLQGLVALAGPRGLILKPDPNSDEAKQLRLLLEPRWQAIEDDALVVQGSYRELLKEIGFLDSGKHFQLMRDSIERLWSVSIFAQQGTKRAGFRLLSEYQSDESDGSLYVALNPLIASAVIGQSRFTRIEMSEVRAIKGEITRLIHQRLCGWIDIGKEGRVSLDTLCSYVYLEEAKSRSTLSMRRKKIREALAELAEVKWGIDEYTKAKYKITRPSSYPRTNVEQPPY